MRSRRTRHALGVVATSLAALLALSACGTGPTPSSGVLDVRHLADANSAAAVADGDLWPSCWSDDDELYAAFGDGNGFSVEFADVGMTRITGTPQAGFDGENLALGDELGQVWSGEGFTRKPTGMACVDGDLYLAVQDLRLDFNEVPAATIARSNDKGETWTWELRAPMFDDGVFTTIMFLDYGRDYAQAPDADVYAYGLDGNWRDSFDDSVADPQDLYLARMPHDEIQDRTAWEFFAGSNDDGEPTWSRIIDDRVLYPGDAANAQGGAANLTVISQGGIVYDDPLDTYLYTSWTELTFELYYDI